MELNISEICERFSLITYSDHIIIIVIIIFFFLNTVESSEYGTQSISVGKNSQILETVFNCINGL